MRDPSISCISISCISISCISISCMSLNSLRLPKQIDLSTHEFYDSWGTVNDLLEIIPKDKELA